MRRDLDAMAACGCLQEFVLQRTSKQGSRMGGREGREARKSGVVPIVVRSSNVAELKTADCYPEQTNAMSTQKVTVY